MWDNNLLAAARGGERESVRAAGVLVVSMFPERFEATTLLDLARPGSALGFPGFG